MLRHEPRDTRVRHIQEAIRQILLQDWDPISVRHAPEAQDEYDGYVDGVYRLLASGASADAVAEHLCAIERGNMGLKPARARARDRLAVAAKLCRLDVRIQPE